MTSLARLSVLLAATLAFSSALSAQSGLPATLTPAARDTLERLVDSVRASGLPTDPLIAKAAEGVLKRVSEDRIIWAVRALARRQADARAALRPGTGAGTLAAGASALQAGVSVPTLIRLASVPGVSESDLAAALVAVADLVATRVPAEAAANGMELLLRRGASEQSMTAFRIGVTDNIRSGLAPDAALASQTRAFVRNLEARPPGERARPLSDPPARP